MPNKKLVVSWSKASLPDILKEPPALVAVIDEESVPLKMRPRLAWYDRARVLSPLDRPDGASRFLAVTREHSRQAYTVDMAARDLGMGRSSLERRSVGWFHLSPGIIIDLDRVLSLATDLRERESALKMIALRHEFSSQAAMSRFFRRYVGVPPGLYRAWSGLLSMREIDQKLRETDHCFPD